MSHGGTSHAAWQPNAEPIGPPLPLPTQWSTLPELAPGPNLPQVVDGGDLEVYKDVPQPDVYPEMHKDTVTPAPAVTKRPPRFRRNRIVLTVIVVVILIVAIVVGVTVPLLRQRAQGASPTPSQGATPLGATSYGCYVESVGVRTLTGATTADFSNMTVTFCESYCTTPPRKFSLFGLEYGGECYCGNALSQGAFPEIFPSSCSIPCAGNTAEMCGGQNRLSMYGADPAPPAVTPRPYPGYPEVKVTAYAEVGCYTESVGVRTLNGTTVASTAMTVGACGEFCKNSGFVVFGLEYSTECYCANQVGGNATKVDVKECRMVCAADQTQICGGANRLSVYKWS